MERPGVLFSLTLAAAGIAPVPLSATNLPPGFIEELVASDLMGPMSMAWGPGGDLWIGGAQGHVYLLQLGAGPSSTARSVEPIVVAELPVSNQGERGVIGIAVDPDYTRNAHVWVFYSKRDPPFRNRLSRFRHVGDQLVEETVILETPDLLNDVHNGGCLRFTSDKTLFISTGDDGQESETSQNPQDLRGKILHVNRDGSPAAGNPFLDGRDGDPRVWALGLRNPWRFNLQPVSEVLFIADVGAGEYEEVNLGIPGANYGWRLTEGPEPPGVPGITYPIYSYPRTSELGHGIIGGDHAPVGNFPPAYRGNYFFGDVATSELFRMVLDDSNQPRSVERFASETLSGPVDIQFGPDGALYYLAFGERGLLRISYVGGSNRQPVATASVEPDNGEAPLEVTLDGSGSFDPDGGPLRYTWELGDGQRRNQTVVRNSYPAGTYSAMLTVTDPQGGSSQVRDLRIVSGNTRPSPIIQEPAPDRRYSVGERVRFAGIGFDPEEGIVPCERMTWTVIFHHLGHTHPFLGPLQGICEGNFLADPHGEEQTFFEIQLTVEDTGEPLGSTGILTSTQSVEIFPR
jgi:glucose/arabinose dehydrogenase